MSIKSTHQGKPPPDDTAVGGNVSTPAAEPALFFDPVRAATQNYDRGQGRHGQVNNAIYEEPAPHRHRGKTSSLPAARNLLTLRLISNSTAVVFHLRFSWISKYERSSKTVRSDMSQPDFLDLSIPLWHNLAPMSSTTLSFCSATQYHQRLLHKSRLIPTLPRG